ncbi:hypothetical protein OpiT1DRAFT_04552 [Opitutaceae bacterium TAV1]|nr:hypothetical protein OpiT1DRAFT_04552 [Opitutaceae bacterium TAV1]
MMTRFRFRSSFALRCWKYIRRAILAAAALAVVGVILWFWPATGMLDGPRQAVLHSDIPGLELGLTVRWYDLKLNRETQQRTLDFEADGTARLPDYALRTSVVRLWLKRILVPLGRWTACENCYGPMTYASLYRKNEFKPPEMTRLAQNTETRGEVVEFTVSLLPDETQYEERSLLVDDLTALMAEAKAIIQAGPSAFIEPETYGPALRKLNPVRAECTRGSLLVWMGGKVGYTLNPDSAGGPMINGAWMSGTRYPGIQKIERM